MLKCSFSLCQTHEDFSLCYGFYIQDSKATEIDVTLREQRTFLQLKVDYTLKVHLKSGLTNTTFITAFSPTLGTIAPHCDIGEKESWYFLK